MQLVPLVSICIATLYKLTRYTCIGLVSESKANLRGLLPIFTWTNPLASATVLRGGDAP